MAKFFVRIGVLLLLLTLAISFVEPVPDIEKYWVRHVGSLEIANDLLLGLLITGMALIGFGGLAANCRENKN